MRIHDRSESRCWLFWVALGAFVATVLLINPLRETAIEDDWSYALTVRNLLQTGTYQLHDWAAASIPFQAYWGALFTKWMGFSFVSLKISTLVLALLGLLAFFHLAKEHDLDCNQAALLTLGLLGCPLFLLFTFSFMTEIPFLACSLVSIFLYTKALRLRSFFLIFAASVTSSAAIFTRQFGIALPATLFVLWLLEKNRKQQIPFYLLGVLLPAIAALIQLASGIFAPNWTAELRMHQQKEYFVIHGSLLPFHMFWRVTVILQYLALFSMPFLVGIFFIAFRGNSGRNLPVRQLFAFFLAITAGMLYGRFVEGVSWFMSYLPWYLGALSKGMLRPLIVTLATGIGALFVGAILVQRYTRHPGWRSISAHQRFLDLVTFFFLLLHLFYVQFYDRYLLVFLPLGLIVAGRYSSHWLSSRRVVTTLLCLIVLSASALWTRGWISHAEAMWKGGEFLRRQNIAPTQIFGDWTWNCYFTFENYLNEIGHRKQPSLDDFFLRWLPEKRMGARYLVTDTPPPRNKWKETTAIPYRNSFFRLKRIVVLEKIPK